MYITTLFFPPVGGRGPFSSFQNAIHLNELASEPLHLKVFAVVFGVFCVNLSYDDLCSRMPMARPTAGSYRTQTDSLKPNKTHKHPQTHTHALMYLMYFDLLT